MSKKIIRGVGKFISTIPVFGLAGMATGALMQGVAKKKAKPETATQTLGERPMPVADDAKIALEKRKSLSMQRRLDGRSSTILSDGAKLGG